MMIKVLIQCFVVNFLFLFSNILMAQDFTGLFGDGPFQTHFEVDRFSTGEIKENSYAGGHQFQKINNQKIGLFSRYFELRNNLKHVPDFYQLSFGASYKYYLEDQKNMGMSLSYGSASNKLFKNNRDSSITINGTYQYNEKWTWIANYSNNRAFLNNIPLPGFIYTLVQSREKMILLGVPFVYLMVPFASSKFTVKYMGLFPYNQRLRILYNGLSYFKPFINAEQAPQAFFNSSRTTNNQRTFWFERKASVGVEKSFGPVLKFDFQLGRAFDREYFEARSFSRKHNNVTKIDDGTFGSINIRSNF